MKTWDNLIQIVLQSYYDTSAAQVNQLKSVYFDDGFIRCDSSIIFLTCCAYYDTTY